MCTGDRNSERGGRKQRERKRDQISQTDGRLSIRTTLQRHGSAGHHPALSPGGPGARLHPGVLAPTRPNPTSLTWLAQEAQTGHTSLAGDAQTANARPTLRMQTSLAGAPCDGPRPPPSISAPSSRTKGQNTGQDLEPRGSPAPEGASSLQHTAVGRGQCPRSTHHPGQTPKCGVRGEPSAPPGTASGSSRFCHTSKPRPGWHCSAETGNTGPEVPVPGDRGYPEGTNTITRGQGVTG